MGYGRRDTISVWYVYVVSRINRLPRSFGMEQMERETQKMGPCCHILEHSRMLFANNAYRPSRPGVLGMDAIHLYVGRCNSRYRDELCKAERP